MVSSWFHVRFWKISLLSFIHLRYMKSQRYSVNYMCRNEYMHIISYPSISLISLLSIQTHPIP